MKKNLKKEILEKIKDGKINQKSKWFFLTKSYVFWFLSFISVALGSLAFSSTLFLVSENKRAFILPSKKEHILEGFLQTIPYWWVVAFLVLMTVAYFNYKNTYKSYKMENIYIILISLLLSIVFGLLIFMGGFTKKMDERAKNIFPSYKKHLDFRKEKINIFLEKNGYKKKDLKNPEIRKEVMGEIKKEREDRKK